MCIIGIKVTVLVPLENVNVAGSVSSPDTIKTDASVGSPADVLAEIVEPADAMDVKFAARTTIRTNLVATTLMVQCVFMEVRIVINQ